MPGRSAWERPCRENREAVAAFLDTVRRIPADAWSRPLGPDHWTPAQLAEHIVLTYRMGPRELSGEAPFRLRVGTVMQRLLRWLLLPHILFHRSIPLRARAPRAISPSDAGLTLDEVLERLPAAAQECERQIRAASHGHLTHPYFGPIKLPRALRFFAAHTEHHRRQLEKAVATRRA